MIATPPQHSRWGCFLICSAGGEVICLVVHALRPGGGYPRASLVSSPGNVPVYGMPNVPVYGATMARSIEKRALQGRGTAFSGLLRLAAPINRVLSPHKRGHPPISGTLSSGQHTARARSRPMREDSCAMTGAFRWAMIDLTFVSTGAKAP